MRFPWLIVGGALLGACKENETEGAMPGDAGADVALPDAGNQADETCFTTTRVTAATTDDCASSYVDLGAPQYIDQLCPALNTWVGGHVYRCKDDADGGERMPGDAQGCTRIGPKAPATTDWWCEPIVCPALEPLYQSCPGNQIAYGCPGGADVSPFIDNPLSVSVPCTNSEERGDGPIICCQDE